MGPGNHMRVTPKLLVFQASERKACQGRLLPGTGCRLAGTQWQPLLQGRYLSTSERILVEYSSLVSGR